MAIFFGSRGGEFIKTPSHAVDSFGLNNPVLVKNYPLHKFQFAVRFNINPATGIRLDTDSLTVVVDSVKIPSVSIETQEVNEYNRMRLLHTKLSFGECCVTLYDVADGVTLKLWNEYYKYFFKDGREQRQYGYDTYRSEGENTRYFFDNIEIVEIHAGQAIKTVLRYPKITSFEHDTFQYSNIDELARVSFNIKPEFIEYKLESVTIPGNIMEKLEQGSSATAASELFGLFGGGPEGRNSGPLSPSSASAFQQQLTNALAAEIMTSQSGNSLTNAIRNSAITSILQTTNRTNSVGVPTSSSVLDSFGGFTSNVTQSVLTSLNRNQRQNRIDLPTTANRITQIGSVNSGNEQGGGG